MIEKNLSCPLLHCEAWHYKRKELTLVLKLLDVTLCLNSSTWKTFLRLCCLFLLAMYCPSAGASLFYVYTIYCTDTVFYGYNQEVNEGSLQVWASFLPVSQMVLNPMCLRLLVAMFSSPEKILLLCLNASLPSTTVPWSLWTVVSAGTVGLNCHLQPMAQFNFLSCTVFLAISINVSSSKAQITWTLETGSNAVRADSLSYWKL